MSSEDVRMLITVSLPCFTVLVGILINNHRIADLQKSIDSRFDHMNRRFEDLSRLIDARFDLQDQKLYRVEQVLDARLKHLEDR